MTIIRTKTEALGGITEQEKLALKAHTAKWIANALSTEPLDRPAASAAIKNLYAAANLKEPRVVFVDSPRTVITDPTKRLVKYLSDAIPQGPHPTPFNEWISVRLDIVQETIDHLEDLDKGNKTWRDAFKQSQKDISMYEAQAEIAITFLQRLLNPSTSDENLQANIDGQTWLRSLGR